MSRSVETPVTEFREHARLLGLGPAQIVGGALAAVTAALAASFLGVAGTLIGAAIGSIVSTIGGAIYASSIHTAHHTLRTSRLRLGRADAPVPARPPRAVWQRWRTLVAVAGVCFVVAVGAITLSEVILGHPVSDRSGSGTTLSRAAGQDAPPAPPPPSAPSSTPGSIPGSTPDSTPTGSGDPGATASATPSADAAASPMFSGVPYQSPTTSAPAPTASTLPTDPLASTTPLPTGGGAQVASPH